MRIGILSDTHTARGLPELGPEPEAFCRSVDLILHTGDVTASMVLDWLEQFAPVRCTMGNHDYLEDDPRVENAVFMEVEGWRIGAKHGVDDRRSDPQRVYRMKEDVYGRHDLDILIAGDSHYERLEYIDDTLLLNSGSAMLPHNKSIRLGGVAILDITAERVRAEVLKLGESLGLPNPTLVSHITFGRSGVIDASFEGEPVQPQEEGWVRWRGRVGPSDQL